MSTGNDPGNSTRPLFPEAFLTGSPVALLRALIACLVLLLPICTSGHSQTIKYSKRPDPKNGEVLYKGGCIACHGEKGSGAPETSTVFLRPDTFPDFTRCDQTTPEANSAWKTIITHGGPNRGFSQIMPAFGTMFTSEQIDDLVAYMRGFCTNKHWPPGELNLPRAIVTEKAFPEDELVLSTAMNATGAPAFTTDVIHEQSFGLGNQIEIDLPIHYENQNHNLTTGVGDITVGLKHVMFSSLRTGSILSLQGGVLLPTGDSNRGFGSGTTTFEPFAAFDQLFKNNTFLQFQAGADLPIKTDITPRSMFWRASIGQAIAGDHGLGRLFSPMVEFLADRDFTQGASTNWDVLPQMQVTLSRRQHIRADIGVRSPFTNTGDRRPQVLFYILWDRADGKFWQGW